MIHNQQENHPIPPFPMASMDTIQSWAGGRLTIIGVGGTDSAEAVSLIGGTVEVCGEHYIRECPLS